MDDLLDMLRAMRLTGGIFLDAEFTAPWCISSQVAPEDCAPFTPVPRHIIGYHYMIAGKCLVKVGNQPPVSVESGQLIVLPRNDAHLMASALNLRPVNAHQLIEPALDGGLAKIVHGGGGELTQILCGFLGNDLPYNAFIALLPSILKLDVVDAASGNWIENNFRFAARELAEGRAKSPTMLAKLAELLFMEAVRRYLASQPPALSAWSAGTRDPIVGRALGLLHGQIARRWTTEGLAREIAVSRSAFAERFTRIIGEPPMRYLARQRFEQASARLRDSADPIARIAFEVGYESEAGFSRAFRREYGVPPASWRRDHIAGKPESPPITREAAQGR
ncbi:AraC family transcriptional regulator [Sinorhizobium garamanticum]|uniref:AraC family transcriptional regulator n=1 Tax=Sinorhizobium garamanticum TaxID=680247 RepID=A0ABY8DAH9_9HYPH|nr:AraC family transcriptional regulator [Sinorhizobium garamanticum]WEX86702.1 AraC family transcriptional regulator [Sinorhizobium garamanticum]